MLAELLAAARPPETTMLEIEVKYRVDDLADLERKLRALGAAPLEDRNDADAYFNAPHRDFAQTDEALRVRRIGPRNFVTYKGPRTDAQTKTRTEVEVPLADGPEADADIQRVLTLLGFRPVAVVRKHRRVFELQREGYCVHACLDTVDRVGAYAELEIVADESHLERARAVVLKCAADLGLAQSERRSYLELLLAAEGRT
jgi:adenylate cyclase, class 2